jgi:CheY-like chemotaxis protein
MITAHGDPETRRKAIDGGATGLLTKPIDFLYFVRKLTGGWAMPIDRWVPGQGWFNDFR